MVRRSNESGDRRKAIREGELGRFFGEGIGSWIRKMERELVGPSF